ncbi:hypothetical protein M433DRAFT_73110 [Acidomyces richmondensis BFW]|nr:MAG: hypothetical protein FE78DRAFT_138557 [Acidomyces sp. 'richmondensis']KYG42760.1 hypothetical protein M433DRAFT_73110 [Acidomyces richmondensis BFW]
MSRPASQHRLSVGASPASLPARHSYSRTHSHNVSLGSIAGGHNRIARRKSSTFSPAANAAALGAAVEHAVADASGAVHRRGGGSALVDGPPLSSYSDKSKPKMRRASDGTRLTKKERAATGDLKCEHCGKAYKHGSCLNKHLWEHTPQWQYTSKLLISKHQQVQLLEAASVLVAMNQDGTGTNDSDNSSSPAASGSSDPHDEELSSAETTPPPHADYRDSKRFSNNSSAYSRSYQSVFSENDLGHHHHQRHWSISSSHRPNTANTSIAEIYLGEDPQDLAAAVGLLSCSHGTPKSVPTGIPPDVPPVPPLPAKYANTFTNYRQSADVDMDDDDDDDSLPDDQLVHRHDEAEEGIFGKMDA